MHHNTDREDVIAAFEAIPESTRVLTADEQRGRLNIVAQRNAEMSTANLAKLKTLVQDKISKLPIEDIDGLTEKTDVNILKFKDFWTSEELDVTAAQQHRCFNKIFNARDFTSERENSMNYEFRSWLRILWPEDNQDCSFTQLGDAAFLNLPKEMSFPGKSPLLRHYIEISKFEFFNDESLKSRNAEFKEKLFLHLYNHVTKFGKTHLMARAVVARQVFEDNGEKMEKLELLVNEALPERMQRMCTLFKTVFFMAKNAIPLTSFENMIRFLIGVSGVDKVGLSHMSRHSARRILLHIAEHNQKKLLELITSPYVLNVTLVLDDTTTRDARKMLVVKFRITSSFPLDGEEALTDMYVSTVFYAFIHLHPDKKNQYKTTAEQHLLAFLAQLDKSDTLFPGFKRALLEKLWSVTADGATVNVKFVELLSGFVGRKILLIHCIAHRLQLVFHDTYSKDVTTRLHDINLRSDTDYKLHKKSRQLVKDLYRFFSTKQQHILAKQATLIRGGDEDILPLKSIQDIRWLAYDRTAYIRVLYQADVIYAALSDKTAMTKETADVADGLRGWLQNRSVLLFMAFQLDLLDIFTPVSKQAQGEATIMADMAVMLQRSIERIDGLAGNSLQSYMGENMKAFVQTCSCGNEVTSCASVEQYLTSNILICNGIRMTKIGPDDIPPFTDDERNKIIQRLKEFFKLRFGENKHASMNMAIFNSTRMSEGLNTDDGSFGNEQITILARAANVEERKTLEQWTRLKRNLNSRRSTFFKMSTAEMIISIINTNELLPESDIELRKVLHFCLIVEPSSAAAESLFSLLKYLRSPRRTQLSTEVLNSETLLRMGRENPEDFKCFIPVIDWIALGRQSTGKRTNTGEDDTNEPDAKRRKMSHDNNDDYDDEESDLD